MFVQPGLGKEEDPRLSKQKHSIIIQKLSEAKNYSTLEAVERHLTIFREEYKSE